MKLRATTGDLGFALNFTHCVSIVIVLDTNLVYFVDNVWLGESENIIIPLQTLGMVLELFTYTKESHSHARNLKD